MRRAVIQQLGSLSTYRYGVETYDPDKLGLGPLIFQYTGATNEDKFAGPLKVGLARPMEQSTAIASQYPWAMQWQNNAAGELDWVFLADLATAAATRRINCYTFNRRTSVFTWKGFVTVTFPGTSEAKTMRAIRMTYRKESTGTVSASGTAVTGIGSAFQTNRVCVGNRMGWPTTPGDASTVPTWYEISAIATDTGLTLASTAGTVGASAYIIEDLRACLGVTSVTTSLGGLYVCKGLNFDAFSSVGGAVPAAVSTDNIRATYFLKDAATGTALAMFGMGIEDETSATSQMLYLLHTLANPICQKSNIRAALTVTSGASTDALVLITGSGGAVTGTTGQLNNARLATPSHGPHSGVQALHFTTTTRIYATPTSNITSASTTWLSAGSVMTEVPPGGVVTFAASGAMGSIEFAAAMDKFIVTTGATQRDYVTEYRTDAGQMSRLFGVNTFQINQATADSTITPLPTKTGGAYTIWSEGGVLYIATTGTTAILNRLYAIPLTADWEYASTTNCRLVMPKVATPDAVTLVQAMSQEVQVIGGKTGTNLGLDTEPFRMSYRTSGIDDNSGSWTLLDSSGLLGVAGSTAIQLMFEFRTIGTMSIPARICSASIIYDDTGMSSYWQGSSNIGTDITNKIFGFRHAVAYGTTVPQLKATLYDAESGANLGTDDSVTQAWTWAKSTNAGGAWGAYNTTDRANADTYIRVTPTSLADSIKVRAELTEY